MKKAGVQKYKLGYLEFVWKMREHDVKKARVQKNKFGYLVLFER